MCKNCDKTKVDSLNPIINNINRILNRKVNKIIYKKLFRVV